MDKLWYLGSVFTSMNSLNLEINARMGITEIVFGQMRS